MITLSWWLMLLSLVGGVEADNGEPRKLVPARCCPESDVFDPRTREVLPKVLVGVVTSTSLRAKKVLLDNVFALSKYNVSWVALLYDDDGSGVDDVRALAMAENVPFQAYDARSSPALECPFCPKFQFHATLVRFARDFDYVILSDADISFRRFDWEDFWAAHRLAGAPLISQPLIRQNTQHTDYFVNSEQWELCPRGGGETKRTTTNNNNNSPALRFVTTNHVENQITFMDATFFSFFAEETRGFTAYQQDHGTAWGQDRIWCLIATVFADRFLGGSENRPSCAIIFEAIDHEDHRDIKKTEEYRKAGYKAQRLLENVLRGLDSDNARLLNMTDLVAQTARSLLLHDPSEDTVARVRTCVEADDHMLN